MLVARRGFSTSDAHKEKLQSFVSRTAAKAKGGQRPLPVWFYGFPLLTFCLGTWQVYRWRQKLRMIQHRKDGLLAPTTALPPHLTEELSREFEFRHVQTRGHFEPLREFIIRPRTQDGKNGGLLVTPFRRSDDGTLVLVNRGWIPATMMTDAAQRRAMIEKVQGETSLFGLLRPGEKKSMFSPENDVTSDQWYWFELDKMKQALNLDYTPPLIDLLSLSSSNGDLDQVQGKESYPIPQPVTAKLSNNHLNYIITWYSLTVALVVILRRKGHIRVL